MPTKPPLSFTNGDSIFGTGDVKVLNYALALEVTEADLYRQCLLRLTTGGRITVNSVQTPNSPGLGLPSTDLAVQYVSKFGAVEAQHRDFLANALKTMAITAPGNPLATAFFDFGIANLDRTGIVKLLMGVEQTGVQAYLGAIPFFATNTYIPVAASIQATEARHTTAITILFNQIPGNTPMETAPLSFESPGPGIVGPGIDGYLTPDQVLAAVSGPNGYIVLP